MRLNDEQRAMLAGEFGPARQWAIRHQMEVGAFFDAADLVPVGQAHIMADTEATGVGGVVFIEQLASLPETERQVRVPTITDPSGQPTVVQITPIDQNTIASRNGIRIARAIRCPAARSSRPGSAASASPTACRRWSTTATAPTIAGGRGGCSRGWAMPRWPC